MPDENAPSFTGNIQLPDLVAALVVLKGKKAAVFSPAQPAVYKGGGEKFGFDFYLFSGSDIKDHGIIGCEHVSGFGVGAGAVFGLYLVGGGGFYIMDLSFLSFFYPVG